MDYLFPMALEFGMTSKEFWYDDPNLFSSYRTFYINKHKKQSEIDNNNAWLFGLYTHNALNVSLSNMFVGKGEQPNTYIDKPIDFSNEKTKYEREKEEQINLEQKLKANLRHYARKDNFIPKQTK